jgi:aminomethyltransferase
MLQLKRTPFHERTSSLCLPQNWRRWAGYIVAGSYDLVLDREYWAIRDAAALFVFTQMMKLIFSGPVAAILLDRMSPRDIH